MLVKPITHPIRGQRFRGFLKYLLKIDLSCFDGQLSCPGGESHDSTERREGSAAVPLAGKAAGDGAALREAPWADGGRPALRRDRADDSAVARAVAPGYHGEPGGAS